MENKYYTPSIEEFFVGFEFEFRSSFEDSINSSWNKLIYSAFPVEMPEAFYYGLATLDKNQFRVKYLDASDIEELGFTCKGKTIDIWFEKEGRFDMGTWTSYKCQFHYGLHDNRLFIDMIDMGDEVRVFNGIVKNKSELKKVLNMLNIK